MVTILLAINGQLIKLNYSRMLLLNVASSDLLFGVHTGEKAMGLIWARDYKTLKIKKKVYTNYCVV